MKWQLLKRDQEKGKAPLTHLRDDLDTFLGDFFQAPFSLFSPSFFPNVDIREDDKGIHIEAELPGMDEKDIDVQLKDRVLTIKGEKKEEKESKNKNGYRMERNYGSFQRSFTLPADADVNKVRAKYKKGVLKLDIPKDPSKAPKKLTIDVE